MKQKDTRNDVCVREREGGEREEGREKRKRGGRRGKGREREAPIITQLIWSIPTEQ